MPWSPLAEGILTDKYSRDTSPPKGSRVAEDTSLRQRRMKDEVFCVVEGLQQLAQEKGCSTAQFALAWCMAQPGITSPVMGPRTVEHLQDNLGALKVEISEADREKIDRLVPAGDMVSSYYESDFGPHRFGWL